MITINLRDYYPHFQSDCFIEVKMEIFQLLKSLAKKEHAIYERRRRHKAFYSLDFCCGLENDFVLLVLSPQEIIERKFEIQELHAAISSLPEKQAKRIYAHFFLHMSKSSIARAEGVSESAIRYSIDRGLTNVKKFLENLS